MGWREEVVRWEWKGKGEWEVKREEEMVEEETEKGYGRVERRAGGKWSKMPKTEITDYKKKKTYME